MDHSDGEIPHFEAHKIPSIRIDGHLHEQHYHLASTGGFVHPATGHAVDGSRVHAEGWVAWTEHALVIAVHVQDRDPQSGAEPEDVDPHIWEHSSGIELMLQPGDPGDNREYYEVQIAANGAMWTTRFDDYNQPVVQGNTPAETRFGHQDWNPDITRSVTRDDYGYTVEFTLPWDDIECTHTAVPPQDGDTWRVNLYSFRDGQRDALSWSPILGRGNFHRSSRFGLVTFRD